MSSQPSVPTNVLASDAGAEDTQVEEKITLASDPGVEYSEVEEAKSLAAPYDYRVYNIGGMARPWSGQNNIYTIRKGSTVTETMDAATNRYLERMEWIQLMSWKNDTGAQQNYSISYTTGLTITRGSEVERGFSLGASYKGMSFGVSGSRRTFKSTETTETKTTTITVNVPARSELYFYQKRYDFRDEMTFVVMDKEWNETFNIGPWGGYNPLTSKVTNLHIMADEYFTRSARLPEGPGLVGVDEVSKARLAGITRKRNTVTQRARNMLVTMGI